MVKDLVLAGGLVNILGLVVDQRAQAAVDIDDIGILDQIRFAEGGIDLGNVLLDLPTGHAVFIRVADVFTVGCADQRMPAPGDQVAGLPVGVSPPTAACRVRRRVIMWMPSDLRICWEPGLPRAIAEQQVCPRSAAVDRQPAVHRGVSYRSAGHERPPQ